MIFPRIYVALSTFAQEDKGPLEALKASGFEFVTNKTGKRLTKAQVIEQVKGFDAVIAGLEPYDREVLEALPQLKCVSRCGVGVDNVDLAVAKARGVAVLNTPQVVVLPVAELTLGLVLDLFRRITAHTELMRQGKWERLSGRDLSGKTAGVIGLGRIGRKVAQVFTALGVNVIAHDIAPDKEWAAANKIKLAGLEELLTVSDILTLHLGGAAESVLIGKAELARMKKGAVLVNVARGGFVDAKALYDALKDGHLAGAGLDVYSEEPYHGPLKELPNVVMTPHVGTLTQESRGAMELEAVSNVLDFLKGGRHA
jgi:D-3-phosphoglycerate dehydrogenase